MSLIAALAQQVEDPAPTGGSTAEEVIAATIVGFAAIAAVVALGVAHRRRQLLKPLVTLVERRFGLPAWSAIPVPLAGASLIIAVWGYYWDVSWHIDRGRDPGAFANPAHWFIIIGLDGIAFAGLLSLILGDKRSRTAVRITDRWHVPVGGVLLSICGVVALSGFPADDIWHRLFGQDVTAWGPTHIQMIFGASLATISSWALLVEGRRAMGGDLPRHTDLMTRIGQGALAGAFLIGMSTLQVEFDNGVPQFRGIYHPVLIVLAASLALVAARLVIGKGGALYAALFFIGARVLLAVGIAGMGRDWLRLPLYLAEALAVEAVALAIPRHKQLTFGAVAGAAVAVVGLPAEWWWSHVHMPIPWSTELLPEVVPLVLVIGVAGGVLGGLVGRALAPDDVGREAVPRLAPVFAWAAAALVIFIPLPMTEHTDWQADIQLEEVGTNANDDRVANVTVRLDPADAADAADDAVWFHVLSWQGADQTEDDGMTLAELERQPDGSWRTDEPVPVSGIAKTLLRLHVGDSMQAVPIFLPEDSAIPADEVPAVEGVRSFEREKSILQREALTENVWLERAAYVLLLGIAFAWFGSLSWGLGRLTPVQPAATSGPRLRGEPRDEADVAVGSDR
ncbi:MAG: hypothetical protein ACRD0G_04825 [Acidimicrobiales bacterium]